MSLTVREKDHWRERIARRIDHAIEEMQAKEDPGFDKRIREQAEQQAWTSLGLDALREESRRIEQESKRLLERESAIWLEMESLVSGRPTSECSGRYSARNEVSSAVKRRTSVHEKELLAASELGQKILRLQNEKEELLDTVWLATSSSQIKELWSRFVDVMNWEPPKLQQEALAITPVSEES